jgi:hypothetical protein
MWRSSMVVCIATRQTGHGFGRLDGGSPMPTYNCQRHRPINYGGFPNARTITEGRGEGCGWIVRCYYNSGQTGAIGLFAKRQ